VYFRSVGSNVFLRCQFKPDLRVTDPTLPFVLFRTLTVEESDILRYREREREEEREEMEQSSSSLYSGPLSQAAQKILAVLRAQSPHAARRNHAYDHRRSQSGGKRRESYVSLLQYITTEPDFL